MPKDRTLSAAFAHFGAKGRNPRWSWSARSAVGRMVVKTFWKDELDYSIKPISYSSFGKTELWSKRPGNKERLKNLIWARDWLMELDEETGEFRAELA